MAESREHEETAKRIAGQYGVEYNRAEGPDVIASNVVVEVEIPGSVHEAPMQLQGHNDKRAYIAGTNQEAVDEAKEVTKGLTIGVMDNRGNIVESSSRG